MKTDTLSRRLRSAPPNPVVRRLVLQQADYIIFQAIHRHGPLPSNYLHEFTRHLRKDETNLKNRLTEFYNGDAYGPYLTRPPQQFAGYEARYQHLVYDLTQRGRDAIDERSAASVPKRPEPFVHQLMNACVGASIELTVLKRGLRYIPREEILDHPKCPPTTKVANNPMAIPVQGLGDQRALIPDDLFGIQYPDGGYRFFAVEIDRNTESIERRNLNQNSLAKKIVSYLDILHRKTHQQWWGLPNLHILVVTVNARHARNILAYIEKLNEHHYAERFGIKFEPSFGANWRVPKALLEPLITEPWGTVAGKKDIGQS